MRLLRGQSRNAVREMGTIGLSLVCIVSRLTWKKVIHFPHVCRHGVSLAPVKLMDLHRLTADTESILLKEGWDCVLRYVRHLHFDLSSIWKLWENRSTFQDYQSNQSN